MTEAAALTRRGVPDPPVSRGSETRCFLRDPDGHLFELNEYRGLRRQAQARG